MRQQWSNYFKDVCGVIWVLDSVDVMRLNEAASMFSSVMYQKMIPLILLANKQDLPNALSLKDLSTRLGITSYNGRHKEFACSFIKNTGVEDGIKWIAEWALKVKFQAPPATAQTPVLSPD